MDWGERRLGLARSDALGLTAQPLVPVILPPTRGNPEDATRRRRVAAADAILAAVASQEISHVVVGLPLELSGKVGEAATQVEALVELLRARLPETIPVTTWDERFTSALAERSLREEGRSAGRRSGGGRERTRAASPEDKARVDQRAAALLLQSWLDAHPRTGAP